MTHSHQLSLPAAILININVMLGAGIFINTTELAKRAGILGACGYALVGILLLPLIFSISYLLTIHPSGGFYIFAQKEISPWAGFLSAWTYFIAKLASAMLLIHTAVLLIQQIIQPLASIDPLICDLVVLALYIGLNLLNTQIGSVIQTMFISVKIIPIVFVFLCGLFFMQGSSFTVTMDQLLNLPRTIPLVLYAMVGFEAACSLSSRIKDAHKNAPLAIFISYGIVLIILCLYQLFFYGVLGLDLAAQPDYRHAFPALLHYIMPTNEQLGILIISILHLGIAASALGGAYGIIFSNNWNLYTLAQHGHTFSAARITEFNRHHIPWLCVIIEGIICVLYLAITKGSQIPLQQISALGSIIAYTLSVVALIYAKKNKATVTISWWIPALGLFNCIMLLAACLYSFWYKGAHSLLLFTCLLAFGIWMFRQTQASSTQLNSN